MSRVISFCDEDDQKYLKKMSMDLQDINYKNNVVSVGKTWTAYEIENLVGDGFTVVGLAVENSGKKSILVEDIFANKNIYINGEVRHEFAD